MGGSLQIDVHASSDRVRERWGGWGRDGNNGPKTPPATPFLYGAIDLGLQPWVGCTSRSWCKNGGSNPFASLESSPFLNSENLPLNIMDFESFFSFHF
jgi:hypothetical protein